MSFTGFPAAALDFYDDLEMDNTKTFWTEHKHVYEESVRAPMAALLAELEEEFGTAKLFRPYRDVRFAKDKTPYKTHQGAFVAHGTVGVGWYLQIDADGLLAGGGWRAHEPEHVKRYRAAVESDSSGPALAKVVGALEEDGFSLEGDRMKTRPRGVPEDHPRLELLRCRSLMVFRRYGAPDWLATPRTLDEVRTAWREVRPVAAWVHQHVTG